MLAILSLLLGSYDVPSWHYSDIKSISLINYESNQSAFNDEAIGLYYPLDYKIELFSDAGEDALIHEIGHHVWFTFDFDKSLFGKAPFITEYSEMNKEEDFAETYRMFYLSPSSCNSKPRLKLKCNIIKTIDPYKLLN